ncbi:MAG: hypothetical protein AAF799_25770 [Myxococcota bacterium]
MPRRLPELCAALAGSIAAACGPSISLDEDGTGTGGRQGSTSTPPVTAEGADTSDGGSGTDLPPQLCEPDATVCDGSEYGTWRLSSVDTQVVAHLYLWPSDLPGQREFVSRWFIEDEEIDYCSRNGRYLGLGDLDDTFVLQTDGMGGTNLEQCGGSPGAHNLNLEFSRLPDCEGEVLVLTATDSNGASLYTFEGHAVHCGCETDYDPYSGSGEQIPTDGCLSP